MNKTRKEVPKIKAHSTQFMKGCFAFVKGFSMLCLIMKQAKKVPTGFLLNLYSFGFSSSSSSSMGSSFSSRFDLGVFDSSICFLTSYQPCLVNDC